MIMNLYLHILTLQIRNLLDPNRWVKKFFLHPNELLIWAYTENLVEIGLVVEAVDELCGRGGQGTGRDGRGRDVIV